MPIPTTRVRTTTVWTVAVLAFVLVAQGQESIAPVPIRNDVARPLVKNPASAQAVPGGDCAPQTDRDARA